jgi:soluble P-type ATPase
MLTISIPGRETLTLEHLVCDLNGTLAKDGLLLDEVAGRLAQVSRLLTVHVVTADTHGTLERIAGELRDACVAAHAPAPRWERISAGEEKARYVQLLGAEHTVVMGNGANDEAMFQCAALSIGVLGDEGAFPRTLLASQIVVTSPLHALDLLAHPARLIATLRP